MKKKTYFISLFIFYLDVMIITCLIQLTITYVTLKTEKTFLNNTRQKDMSPNYIISTTSNLWRLFSPFFTSLIELEVLIVVLMVSRVRCDRKFGSQGRGTKGPCIQSRFYKRMLGTRVWALCDVGIVWTWDYYNFESIFFLLKKVF